MGSAGPADVAGAGAAGILVQTPEVSELGIALLSFVFFVRCSIRRLLVRLEPAALLVKGWMR